MGSYCQFCNNRCFQPFPVGAPAYVIVSYPPGVSLIATCEEGQAHELQRFGWSYDKIIHHLQTIQNKKPLPK